MSDFRGFNESFLTPSDGVGLSKQTSLNIPSIHIKQENGDNLSKSLDSKRLISSHITNGGVSKPYSRKNSVMSAKQGSEDEDDDDDDDEDKSNERKRRDNINEKIQELLLLIPGELFTDLKEKATPIPKNDEEADIQAAMRNSGTKDGKPNKGQILTKSVEYLQQLQNQIDENNRKEVELIMKLKSLEQQGAGASGAGTAHTSAERALGKIGVGPFGEEYFKKVLISRANKRKNSN